VLVLLFLFHFSPSEIHDPYNIGDSAQGSFIGIQIGKSTVINTPVW
jgi:hypothetical protein